MILRKNLNLFKIKTPIFSTSIKHKFLTPNDVQNCEQLVNKLKIVRCFVTRV